MRTIIEIERDGTLDDFARAREIRQTKDAEAKAAAFAALPGHRSTLETLRSALRAHDSKVVMFAAARSGAEASAKADVDLADDRSLDAHIRASAKAEIIRSFLNNSETLRRKISSGLYAELQELPNVLRTAGVFDHRSPPAFTVG